MRLDKNMLLLTMPDFQQQQISTGGEKPKTMSATEADDQITKSTSEMAHSLPAESLAGDIMDEVISKALNEVQCQQENQTQIETNGYFCANFSHALCVVL